MRDPQSIYDEASRLTAEDVAKLQLTQSSHAEQFMDHVATIVRRDLSVGSEYATLIGIGMWHAHYWGRASDCGLDE
jgi:hypothetical protein